MTLAQRRSMLVLFLTVCGVGAAAAQDAPAARVAAARNPAATEPDSTLFSVLARGCRPERAPELGRGGPYLVVSSLGDVIAMHGAMTEGDSLRVMVLGPPLLLSRVTVARTSGTRARGTVNVVGGQANTGRVEGVPPGCSSATWTLRDFAPGIGQVEVDVLWPNGKPDDRIGVGTYALSKPAFPVSPLYRGALFFAVVGTSLRNAEYGLRTAPSDSTLKTIAYTSRPGGRLEYALFYTHFWFHPRDIETDRRVRIDPAIGLVLNDLPNHALVGFAGHVGYSFYVVGGFQFGKIHDLDHTAGVHVGDGIRGGASAIPVVSRITMGWFLGGGFDLRATGRLFGLLSK